MCPGILSHVSPAGTSPAAPSSHVPTEAPVLDVYYELNPVPTTLDLLLRITTLPLDIVYNEDIIDRSDRISWNC